jgi:hypothetical protein
MIPCAFGLRHCPGLIHCHRVLKQGDKKERKKIEEPITISIGSTYDYSYDKIELGHDFVWGIRNKSVKGQGLCIIGSRSRTRGGRKMTAAVNPRQIDYRNPTRLESTVSIRFRVGITGLPRL